MTTLRHPPKTPGSVGGRFRDHNRTAPDDVITDQMVVTDDASIAADPQTPAGRLSKLSYSRDLDVRMCVAANPSTPGADLVRMLDRGAMIRPLVLSNPSLPADVAEAVAQHPKHDTDLADLAHNPAATPAVLERAALVELAQWTVAGHVNASPAALLAIIANTTNIQLVAVAGCNINATDAVRIVGSTRIDEISTWQAADGTTGSEVTTTTHSTSPAYLEAQSWSKNAAVRRAVAANPRTPEATLRRYLTKGIVARADVLKNPGLSDELVTEVARKPKDGNDLRAIATRSSLPAEVFTLCERDVIAATTIAGRADTPEGVWQNLASSGARQVAQTVAENVSAPAGIRATAAARVQEILDALNAG